MQGGMAEAAQRAVVSICKWLLDVQGGTSLVRLRLPAIHDPVMLARFCQPFNALQFWIHRRSPSALTHPFSLYDVGPEGAKTETQYKHMTLSRLHIRASLFMHCTTGLHCLCPTALTHHTALLSSQGGPTV